MNSDNQMTTTTAVVMMVVTKATPQHTVKKTMWTTRQSDERLARKPNLINVTIGKPQRETTSEFHWRRRTLKISAGAGGRWVEVERGWTRGRWRRGAEEEKKAE